MCQSDTRKAKESERGDICNLISFTVNMIIKQYVMTNMYGILEADFNGINLTNINR